ncbi:MAG: Hsp33 family molecular chaperone HslO [Clostridiales bacterium]|nr:Hsp33 family molecular chaperone HslO [Clostridiales bacterium]
MNDQLVRAMTKDGFVKAVAVTTKTLTERARQIHKTLPTATAALGRLLAAASMMGNMQKVDDGSITLQVKGGGPLGTLLAVSDAAGNVRGWVEHPQISLLEKYRGKLDVGAAVGSDGTLTVIRDLRMKDPYIGSVQLVSGEIAEDITQYFAQSEQTPTACALGVLIDTDQSVRAAGGYLVQLLPGAPDDVIDRLEAGVQAAGAATAMLDGGLDAAGMLQKVLSGFEVEILETQPIEYRCYCTRRRVESTLISLGKDELEQVVRDGETLHVDCQFCDQVYDFTPQDVAALLRTLEEVPEADA